MPFSSAMTLWFTGLSGSGKTTLAYALQETLAKSGAHWYVLDGDVCRTGLCKDLGFSAEDRAENIRRCAEVARILNEAGVSVITAFICPYAATRQLARSIVGDDRFFEVHVNTPLEKCEERDPKGLYKLARNGSIKNFTGVSDPYESPAQPAVSIDTSNITVEQAVNVVLATLGLR